MLATARAVLLCPGFHGSSRFTRTMITHPGPIDSVEGWRQRSRVATVRGEVVHLGALKLRDDRHALGHGFPIRMEGI